MRQWTGLLNARCCMPEPPLRHDAGGRFDPGDDTQAPIGRPMTRDSDRSEIAANGTDKLSSASNSPTGIAKIRDRHPGRFRPIGIVVLGMHRSALRP